MESESEAISTAEASIHLNEEGGMALLRYLDRGKAVILFAALLAGCTQNTSVKEVAATKKKDAALYKGKQANFWMKQLTDKDASFRLEAISALREIGPEGDDVLRSLLAASMDKDRKVQEAAAEAVSAFPPESTMTVLIQATKSNDHHERLSSIAMLGLIGPKARAALPALKEALKASDPEISLQAFKAIRAIEVHASTVQFKKVQPTITLRGMTETEKRTIDCAVKKSSVKWVQPLAEVKKGGRILELNTDGVDEKEKPNCTVQAPWDGIITQVAVKNGEQVVAGQLLLRMESRDKISVSIRRSLPLAFLIDKPGQPAVIHTHLYGDWKGTVVSIDIDRNPTDGWHQPAIWVSVDAPLDGLKLILKPGIFVTVQIVVGQERTVLAVPTSAVNAEKCKCLVQGKDGGLEARKIEVGSEYGDLLEIVSGLREGEAVVTDLKRWLEIKAQVR